MHRDGSGLRHRFKQRVQQPYIGFRTRTECAGVHLAPGTEEATVHAHQHIFVFFQDRRDLGNVLKDHFFIRFHIRDLLIHITIIGMLRAHPAEPGAVIIEPDHGDTLSGSHLFQLIPNVREGILRQRLRRAAGPSGKFIFQPVIQMGIIVIWRFVTLPGADRHIFRREVLLVIGDSPSGDSVVREVAQIKVHVAYPCSHLRSANRDRLLPDLHLCSFLSGSLHRHDHTVIGTIETSVRIRNINRILAVIQVLQDHSFRFRTRHTGSKRKR